MQAATLSAAQEPSLSMFDEISALLNTRLDFHQTQLQHHQKRIDEIEDMKEYLGAKFAPKVADQAAPADAETANDQPAPVEANLAEHEAAPVEASVESAMTKLHPDPAAPDTHENEHPTEQPADPNHQTFGYQSMY